MKNKKGFTLIELLAVIVILAIIALIAVPIILNMITQARKSAARSATLGYVDAIEYNNGFADVEQEGYTKVTGTKQVSEIDVKMKGKKPDSGSVTIDSNGKVESATLCINGYNVTYENGDTTVGDKCSSNGNNNQQQNIPAPVSFETDSWVTIANNTTSDKYHVGDTKEVELDMNNDVTKESYTVRIANTSTPSECSTPGFSQTACGFVIEFVDIVESRVMNTNRTNEGGWNATAMRAYLNGDFYNSLPEELRNVIISTNPVVSGSGSGGVSLDTNDRIYLLSGKEIGVHEYDNKADYTRLLGYYSLNSGSDSKVKKLNNSAINWYLRGAVYSNDNAFNMVTSYGSSGTATGHSPIGVAPAFRIGVNS